MSLGKMFSKIQFFKLNSAKNLRTTREFNAKKRYIRKLKIIRNILIELTENEEV
ncbi:hypothetical protein H1R16_06765 [Marnyiella aurantia]|uniref:Uncharacterized protein n=1 Tax=Marnyiella aurantia TaxID=2758037 RepID=A0A7D7LRZ8_9FLAO|nr:hypothetical protein [Marnyiella aurantia]MBA5247240.1 hypothetical protein [Marnyiella aurantia]QMS97435.1 hypothetical protein H1R16_06765 [Marnyiella aurantia]